MRRLLVVLLIPVVAQLIVHGCMHLSKGIGEASVQAWKADHDRVLEEAGFRE
jgi:hypothetical protein